MVTNNTFKPLAENNETLFLLHLSGAKHSSQFWWEEGMAASSQSLSTGTSKCFEQQVPKLLWSSKFSGQSEQCSILTHS